MSTKHGLKRNLKKLDTLALSFGAMIGWSWVALSTEIIGRGGSVGGIIGTVVVGFIILAIGLIYSELTAAMPAALVWPNEWSMVLAWFCLGGFSYWFVYRKSMKT